MNCRKQNVKVRERVVAYNTSGKSNGLADQSILRAYGYTVAQKENLSAQERQELLAEIVDLNHLSVKQIVTLLELQINTKKKRFPVACRKYEADRDFIMAYEVNPERFTIAPYKRLLGVVL